MIIVGIGAADEYTIGLNVSIKSDRWIIRTAKERKMISPFAHRQVSRKVISYGVSAYGYDFRLSDEFQVFTPANGAVIDPKNHQATNFVAVKAKSLLIPPNSFILGRSLEYFRIPREILTICFGKSTYARCGLVVNVTPFEPEWEGYATLSIINSAPLPVRIYAKEGIAQLIFLEADEVCQVSYADKKGKYQAQKRITNAKVKS
jgi:dCTP deaminase